MSMSSEATPATSQVRFRAVLVALLFIPVNAFWITFMEAVKYTGHPTTYSLYFNCVLLLGALTAINALLRRLWKAPFTTADLLLIYFMVALATALAGHDQAQVLVGVIAWPLYKATPENHWATAFGERIPHWLIPRDPEALKAFFVGHSSLTVHWKAWLAPLGCWFLFTLVLIWMFLCINTILRRQWVENERLTFPLVALPLEMAEPTLAFYRQRMMWVAFLLPCFINVVNNLHQWFPGVPEIATRTKWLNQYLTQHPWNSIGGTPLFIFPFAIGIGYLLPLDVLGSSWIFFWWWKAQTLLGTATGWTTGKPFAPYINEQAFGGYIGLAVLAIYAGRIHFWRVVKSALGRDPEYARTRGEGLPYPVAVWGIVAGFAALCWFGAWAKMEIFPVLLLFTFYFALSLAIDRLRAEFGCPTHDLHNAYIGELLPRAFGATTFHPQVLTGFALLYWFNRAHRSHPMPVMLESQVAAFRIRASQSKYAWALMAAAVVGIISGYIAVIEPHYWYGAESAKVWQLLGHFGREAWGRLEAQIDTPLRPLPESLVGLIIGFLSAVSLFLVRIRAAAFPLHPVGYAVSSSWSLNQVWLSLLIAWCCKVAIVRAGGLRLYRRAIPFFLGLILGDFVSGGLFNIVGIVWDLKVYHFLG